MLERRGVTMVVHVELTLLRSAGGFAAALLLACCTTSTPLPSTPYLGANHVPDSRPGWQALQTAPDPTAPLDEAAGGFTARGTPINKRNPACFPAETRNLFYRVDEVPDPHGNLEPFDYTNDSKDESKLGVTADGRNAIRGQNTWMLWGEGNEAFWGWLQERGYGLVDFLVVLDSRQRSTRFRDKGMINQPGMMAQTDPKKKLLGLYLDVAGPNITLTQPPGGTDKDASTQKLAERVQPPADHKDSAHTQLFTPGDPQLYQDVLNRLPQDGVDPNIYGYPSGVIGLRLFPNPDFFGNTDAARRARAYWKKHVEKTGDAYYDINSGIQKDPDLVRPFRVSMSCAFCHLGPHPLNPPKDVENPEWDNLSSTIGNQYWSPQPLFANLQKPNSLFYQFLKSQQPGTVDTSLVSTDHINNPNTITAIFDVRARLVRSTLNPPEKQSPANLLSPIAVAPPLTVETNQAVTPRHTPRVLLDGADSIGVFGALSRVYLNIGTFPEEWARAHNPIIGYVPQRPFPLATLQKNSVYWQTSEKYRIPYLVAFFSYASVKTGESIVAPMKLADAPGGAAIIEQEQPLAEPGRAVFLKNCAICHSSKQPEGFALSFSSDWRRAAVPRADQPASFTLPMSYQDWDEFKQSGMYKEYVKRLLAMPEIPKQENGPDNFLTDNFLSTDIRVPVTLVGTNSARAVATNGMRGQVWDNFSSETYKNLPAVGAVHFYNPFSHKPLDKWGNNDVYYPPRGGPGYYRPASLISLWATGPYLHNNTLGIYTADPSVQGRLRAFDDGIDKLLWTAKRVASAEQPAGDLRWGHPELAGGDPGFIYRMTEQTWIPFAPKFIRPLFEGILGSTWTNILTFYLWLALAIVGAILAITASPRHAAFLLLVLATAAAAVLVVTRLDRVWWWLWIVPIVLLGLAVILWLRDPRRLWGRVVFVVFALGSLALGIQLHAFVNGDRGPINVGPIPQGTPLNLIMNINPEAPTANLIRAVSAMTRGILLSRREKNPADALRVFEEEAGQPLLEVSKCPDFVLDRGHWFGEALSDNDKKNLKAFLKTL
jgi:hypothetical protein